MACITRTIGFPSTAPLKINLFPLFIKPQRGFLCQSLTHENFGNSSTILTTPKGFDEPTQTLETHFATQYEFVAKVQELSMSSISLINYRFRATSMFLIHGTPARVIAASLLVLSTLFFISHQPSNHRYLQQSSLQLSTHRGFGTHYITLYVGNPAQAIHLALSTDSGLTVLPCVGSTGVKHHTDKPYNYTHSGGDLHMCPNQCVFPTSKCRVGTNNQCTLFVEVDPQNRNVIGGYKGVEISTHVYIDTGLDKLHGVDTHKSTIASSHGFSLDFVCQTSVIGDMTSRGASGILGMNTEPTSFLHQMYHARKIPQRMFSLCFRSFHEYQPEGVSAGLVTLGGYDASHFDTPLVWAKNTANVQHRSNYAVHIRKMYLGVGGGNVALERASQGTMSILPIQMEIPPKESVPRQGQSERVDYSAFHSENGVVQIQTNAPTTCLHKSAEAGFKQAFRSITGMKYQDNMNITPDQFEMLPTVLLQMEVRLQML